MDVDVSVVDKISAEICQSHYGKARDMIRQAYKKYGTIFVTTFLEYMDINHIGNHSSYLNELIKLVHPKTLKYGSSLEQFVYIMYFATPDDFIDVFVGINESCFSTIYTHSALSQYTRKYGMTTIIDILDALATLNKDAHLVLVEYGYITLGMYEHFTPLDI